MDNNQQRVRLRKFPFPYRACLSICSDIDDTDTRDKFEDIQTFMNKEIGIKFTNTFFPFHDGGEFSLFSSSQEDRGAILKYIKEGAIDAMHSYGEKNDFCRNDALRALDELNKNNCRLQLWVDHAQSKSNFCKHRFPGKGDIPKEKEYHADLTLKHGIKFIWTERLTNIIGQDVPLSPNSLWQIYDSEHPFYSLLGILKTSEKIALSIAGYKKYNYFKNNALVTISTLQDGQKVYEFVRFNNYYTRPREGSSFKELHYLISKKVLNRLKEIEGYSIVYVHLGKNFNLDSDGGRSTVSALLNLKKETEEGSIYVDSTLKILRYYITHKYLVWYYEIDEGKCDIHITGVDDPVFGFYVPELQQLEGIAFYVPDKIKTHIFINGQETKNIKNNPPDFTGKNSTSLTKN